MLLPDGAPESAVAELNRQLGLREPLVVQYGLFLSAVARGDFGQSFQYRAPALRVVLERLPATVELGFVAMVLSVVIGVPLGMYSAVHRGGALDSGARVFAVLGQDTKAPPPLSDGFQLQDFQGAIHSLDDVRDRKLVVIAFLGVECPVVSQYAPRLAELAGKFEMSDAVAATFCKDDYPLLALPAAAWGGTVFVNLDSQAMPFERWLGDLPQRFCRHPLDEMVLMRRRTYRIRANWKLIAENFMEYYHLPFGHPELCNVSGFDNHYRYQGPGMYTGISSPSNPGDEPTNATIASAWFAVWIACWRNCSTSGFHLSVMPEP